uniref:Uncharacterized protein n=1 Tax=Anopheles epiroticus TaxID=199890 RepID=A0A182PR18_9DIPT
MTVAETYENQAHYDITFLMFVWIAFLPTIIVPWIYASWVLSKPTKERLRGYLRLSSRRNTRSEQSLDEPGSTPPGKHAPSATPMSTVGPSLKPMAGQPSARPGSPGPHHRRTPSSRTASGAARAASLHPDVSPLSGPTGTATTSMTELTGSPAGNSARTVETTISRQSSVGRPRRQLPPPLRIEESNFHKTPSVKSGRTLTSSAHNSSVRSTASRASRASSTAPLYPRRYSTHGRQPSQHEPEEEDDVSSLVGNSSDVTSSTYCCIGPELYGDSDPLGVGTRRSHSGALPVAPYRRRSSAQTQSTGRSAHYPAALDGRDDGMVGAVGGAVPSVTGSVAGDDDDDVSEIFSSVSQPSARKRPAGILKATPSIVSISESEYSSRKGSFSTLSRDLEIIDQLERERSMDIQEMIQREKTYEQYLVRQNSKLKFSTNFDEYFEAAAAAAAAAAVSASLPEPPIVPSHQAGGAQLPPQPAQLPAPPSGPGGAAGAGSLSPRRARSPMHRRGSQLPTVGVPLPSERPTPFGPRRSIELERRFHRTYSTSGSTRSSTKSRDRITFQDDV